MGQNAVQAQIAWVAVRPQETAPVPCFKLKSPLVIRAVYRLRFHGRRSPIGNRVGSMSSVALFLVYSPSDHFELNVAFDSVSWWSTSRSQSSFLSVRVGRTC